MEKLQAALQQARNARSEAGQAPTTSLDRGMPKAAQPLPSVWNRLKAIELSQHMLAQNFIVSRDVSKVSSPFDVLRTKVLLQMQQNNWKRLAITSPRTNSGKSTMACNLSMGLGRQENVRTMLFDCDLSSPSIHTILGHEPEFSFSQVLKDEVPFEEQGLRVGSNIAISLSRAVESDPTRLLMSDRTGHILSDIEKNFAPDMMIFDMSSMLEGDRVRAFLQHVDCALIVVRANHTQISEFDVCEREVSEQTNVLGVVLNGCTKGAM